MHDLEPYGTSEDTTVIDRFGRASLRVLLEKQPLGILITPLPSLTTQEIAMIRKATATEYDATVADQEEEEIKPLLSSPENPYDLVQQVLAGGDELADILPH